MMMRCTTGVVLAVAAAALAACQGRTGEPPMAGVVEAELLVVSASVAGNVERVAVRRGDRVAAGAVLVTLDGQAEQLARDAAAARREAASAQDRNLRKGRRPAELAAIEQQLQQAEAQLAASAAALQRNQRLVSEGFQSAARLDELVAARDRDAARVAELQAQRQVARSAARDDEIAAAAAGVQGSSADLALAEWRRDQRQRLAPRAATVVDVMYQAGEWANAGAPLVTLQPEGALKLLLWVPQPQLPRAAVGTSLRLSCDGCPEGLTARIRFVSPQAEFTPPMIYRQGSRASLVYRVEAELQQPQALRAGQPVDVRFGQAAS